MGYIEKYWPKEEIELAIKELAKEFTVLSKKDLIRLCKEKRICHLDGLKNKFGSITEILGKYGIKYPKFTSQEQIQKMQNINTKWNKENILEGLKLIYKKYGEVKPIELNKYLKQEGLFHAGIIGKHFGTIAKGFEAAGVPFKNYYWTNERIIARLKQLYEENGPFAKTHINKIFLKEDKICGGKLIRDRFGSLEEAARQANINFVAPKLPSKLGLKRMGKLEKDLLDKIEMEKGIKLIRQFQVARKFIDGYDPINNVAYEVDERNHKYNQVQDYLREQVITEEISCTFERIKLF